MLVVSEGRLQKDNPLELSPAGAALPCVSSQTNLFLEPRFPVARKFSATVTVFADCASCEIDKTSNLGRQHFYWPL